MERGWLSCAVHLHYSQCPADFTALHSPIQGLTLCMTKTGKNFRELSRPHRIPQLCFVEWISFSHWMKGQIFVRLSWNLCFPNNENFHFYVGCLIEGEFGIKTEKKKKGGIWKERFLVPPGSGKGFLLLLVFCHVILRVSGWWVRSWLPVYGLHKFGWLSSPVLSLEVLETNNVFSLDVTGKHS